MRKILWLILALALFSTSCSAPQIGVVKLAPGLDPATDTVDEECSYFYFLWGKSAELEGRYEEAREAYEKSLVCDSTGVHVIRKLAILLINMGEKESAASWINEIIKKNPKDISSRSLLANLYSSMGKFDKAAAIYTDILKEEPDNLNVSLLLGALYARNKDFSNARKVLENLVAQNPDSFVAHHYLGKLYRDLHLNVKAEAAYRKALSLNWSTMLAFELAGFLEGQKDFDEAIEVYQLILKNDSTNESARARIAKIYLRQKKVDAALGELKKLREYAIDAPKVDFTIAKILLEQKKFSEATTVLSAILDKNPQHSEARSLLALVYHERGLDRAAMMLLRAVQPGDDSYEESVLLLVKIYRDNKQFSEAISFLGQKTKDGENRQQSFYLAKARIYRDMKDTAAAEATYLAALKVYPESTTVIFEYGVFLDEKGDQPGAIARMQAVLKIDPDDPYAMNYIGYTWAENGEKLDEALAFIKKAAAMKPDDGFILDSLGWVYFRKGDIDNAVKAMEKAVKIVATDATIYEHMGDIYTKAAKKHSAIEAYEKSLKLYSQEDKKEGVRRKIKALKH